EPLTSDCCYWTTCRECNPPRRPTPHYARRRAPLIGMPINGHVVILRKEFFAKSGLCRSPCNDTSGSVAVILAVFRPDSAKTHVACPKHRRPFHEALGASSRVHPG